MKFFPRLLLLTSILFVVLGLCNKESGNTTPSGDGLRNIEFFTDQAGLATTTCHDPPVPSECILTRIRMESHGRSYPALERVTGTRCAILMTRINSDYLNRSPEMSARTGHWIHTTADNQPEGTSRS